MKDSIKPTLFVLIFSLITALTVAISNLLAASAEFQHISPEELKNLIETKGDIVIVDTQPKSVYEIGHIKRAINFPWAKEIKGPVTLPKNKLLILYCDCTHEEDSTDVATQLVERWGYNNSNIKLLTGGWSGWLKLGYPTEKGKSKGK
ncbi:MAG: rhodanese-like domain-containing protein [Thermodesulfobacteriota bacterium]